MKCNFCEKEAVWEIRVQTVNFEEGVGGLELNLVVCDEHKTEGIDKIYADIIEFTAGCDIITPDPVTVRAFPLIQ